MAYNHRDRYNHNDHNNNDNLNENPAARVAPEYFENLFLNGNFAANADEEMLDAAVAPAERNNLAENANYEPSCWVFGYGSLCWYPGFDYSKCITGYIKGFVRRFWQGNTTHRGTDEKVSIRAFLAVNNKILKDKYFYT